MATATNAKTVRARNRILRLCARPLHHLHGRLTQRLVPTDDLGAFGHLALRLVRAVLDGLEMWTMREDLDRLEKLAAELDRIAEAFA